LKTLHGLKPENRPSVVGYYLPTPKTKVMWDFNQLFFRKCRIDFSFFGHPYPQFDKKDPILKVRCEVETN
jgi:hypothetical protein